MWILMACWPASLAYLVSSRQLIDHLKTQDGQHLKSNSWCSPLASTQCPHTPRCTCTNTSMHAHAQRKKTYCPPWFRSSFLIIIVCVCVKCLEDNPCKLALSFCHGICWSNSGCQVCRAILSPIVKNNLRKNFWDVILLTLAGLNINFAGLCCPRIEWKVFTNTHG